MPRTRVKICGITRRCDLDAALSAGADAVGFVFYPPSPRCLATETAGELARAVPPFAARVGLFVNAEARAVRDILAVVPLDLLQFHGEEPREYCEQFGLPYLKAARVRPDSTQGDLLEFAAAYSASALARGMLLDAWVEAYGGVGQSFDWSLIPANLPLPIVLSGGLHAGNVGEAVANLQPWAVDVSSGVELAKGVKDAGKIAAFMAAVRTADANR